MKPHPGGYALVTGASRGIGAAFAQGLAEAGWNLVLSARLEADLERLRQRLLGPGRDVRCIAADLSQNGAAAVLAYMDREGLAIELLVNNAGLGSGGEFSGLDPEREREEIQVNILALLALTQGCLPAMRERGRGAIVNVASTAAFQPVPYMATYAATKAFVLHFSLALHEELRHDGVHVMALCPGPTTTEFFRAAGISARGGAMQNPEAVVGEALRGLRERRALVVCGARNRAMIAAERWLPRGWVIALVARIMRKRPPSRA